MKYTSERRKKCIRMYKLGLPIKSIIKREQIDGRQVSKWLSEEGISIKSGSDYLRKAQFDESYFENIDTPDKAYFLGLIYADGNIYLKRNRLQISLQNEDRYILEEFRRRIRHTGRLYSDRGLYSSFVIHSKKIVQDLANLGVYPRKSLTIQFPSNLQVPNELLSHFIRGFFDGDGCISFNKSNCPTISFTSNESFLVELGKHLATIGIECSIFRKRYKHKAISAGSIHFSGASKRNKFYEYIYGESDTLRLERKFKKFHYVNS